MSTRIELRKVAKSYGKTEVLRSVDLIVEPGEFTVFVGPSGCGKSTLLRMIAGLEQISGGELLIDGRRMNEVPPARREIAMVFQSYALYPHMNVFDNLAFGLRTAGYRGEEVNRRVANSAEILKIGDLLRRKPRTLSGGQRQRVAIGRAIVRDPKIFLFDEPLSNLDAELRVQMRLEIAQLHKRLGNTMIYVTHDQTEAMTMADNIAVLRHGELMQVGRPLDLYNTPANLFVAGFIGSPKMNMLSALFEDADPNGSRLSIAGRSVPLSGQHFSVATGEPITIGVRPEHLTIDASGSTPLADADVQLVEQLGGSTLIHAVTKSREMLTVSVNGQVAIEAGARLALGFRPEKLHVFTKDGLRANRGAYFA